MVPQQQVDIRGGENRRPPYVTAVNPRGQCPALALPSGDVVAEILPICELIEELPVSSTIFQRRHQPQGALCGVAFT